MTGRNDVAPPSVTQISARALKAALHDGGEIALLDVREHGQYGEGHPFLAVPLPYSRLEIGILRLVPRRRTRIVLYDDGPQGASAGVALMAARRLAALGYSDLRILEGGLAAWVAAGCRLFAGVNVPSKTFGELLEQTFTTPHISARELEARLARGEDLVVIDGRPVEEYRKMSLPTAICCPNGELALRSGIIAPKPSTTIVINCAGRTRSIVGAQTLIDIGVPNPVFALENGTQGWYLEDLPLDHGAQRHYPPQAPEDLPALKRQARDFAARWAVPFVDVATVAAWREDPLHTLYLLDVRTPEEFARGSLAGAIEAPGGQLIQATDHFVATRGARLVLLDDELVRAPVIAARLRQMGWEVAVLEQGIAAALPPVDEPPAVGGAMPPLVAARALIGLAGAAMLLDLRPSQVYRAGHLRGACWTIRPRLSRLKPEPGQKVVLIVDTPEIGRLAAMDLAEIGVRDIGLHLADPAEWAAAGLALEATPDCPRDADAIDFLFFVHDRHDGNKDAARRYLAWELGLLAQIDAQERAIYRI